MNIAPTQSHGGTCACTLDGADVERPLDCLYYEGAAAMVAPGVATTVAVYVAAAATAAATAGTTGAG